MTALENPCVIGPGVNGRKGAVIYKPAAIVKPAAPVEPDLGGIGYEIFAGPESDSLNDRLVEEASPGIF